MYKCNFTSGFIKLVYDISFKSPALRRYISPSRRLESSPTLESIQTRRKISLGKKTCLNGRNLMPKAASGGGVGGHDLLFWRPCVCIAKR